jgi:hypothetical protein
MMDYADTTERLDPAGQILRTGATDPGRIHTMLPSVAEPFYEQVQLSHTLRPTQAGRRISTSQGRDCGYSCDPSWGRKRRYRRHRTGGASAGTSSATRIIPPIRDRKRGEENELCIV